MRKTQILLSIAFLLLTFFTSVAQEEEEFYYIYNQYQGKERVLTALTDGKVVMADKADTAYQQWGHKPVDASGGFYFYNKGLGKEMYLRANLDKRLSLTKAMTTSGQMWYPINTNESNSTFELANQIFGNDYVLDCDPDKIGPVVFMAEDGHYSGQIWSFLNVEMPASKPIVTYPELKKWESLEAIDCYVNSVWAVKDVFLNDEYYLAVFDQFPEGATLNGYIDNVFKISITIQGYGKYGLLYGSEMGVGGDLRNVTFEDYEEMNTDSQNFSFEVVDKDGNPLTKRLNLSGKIFYKFPKS